MIPVLLRMPTVLIGFSTGIVAVDSEPKTEVDKHAVAGCGAWSMLFGALPLQRRAACRGKPRRVRCAAADAAAIVNADAVVDADGCCPFRP